MEEFFRHGYALLIGITESAVDHLSLPIVGKDIKALEQVLMHPQRCAYPPNNVKTLKGKEASRSGILNGLAWLEERTGSDSSGNATAVVYYSGHGWREQSADQPEFFLLPYDVQERRVRLSALRAQDFGEAVDAVQPRRLLVVLDCCHSGGMGVKGGSVAPSGFVETAIAPALLMGGDGGTFPSGVKGLDQLEEGAGRAVLSSSTGEQESYFRTDGTMSIFTYYLIEALTGHAQPRQGAREVLVSDVMGHVSRYVPRAAREGYGAPQQPDHQVRGNFPVALLLGGKGLGAGEPAPDPLGLLEGTGTRTTTITTGDTIVTEIGGNVGNGAVIQTGKRISYQSTGRSPGVPEGDRTASEGQGEESKKEGGAQDGR